MHKKSKYWPYVVRKVPKRKCYSVRNKVTGRVKSKCTSLAKARRQAGLLRSIYKKK